MSCSPHPIPVVIDCDTGRDDALSIWLSIMRGDNLVGVVCSYGNTTLSKVSDNTSRVLSLSNRGDIPLYIGANNPLKDHVGYRNVVLPRQQSSGNGLCNIELPVPELNHSEDVDAEALASKLVSLYEEHGKIDYIIIGPATNFALICNELGDKIHEYVNSVTMMGGKLDALWSKLPGADFNIVSDPYAIDTILRAGVNFRFVPMDFTWPIEMNLDKIDALEPTSDVAEYSKRLMVEHCKNFSPDGNFKFHDPSVIMSMQYDNLFKKEKIKICLDENSDNYGRLSVDGDGYNVGIFKPDSNYNQEFIGNILKTLRFII